MFEFDETPIMLAINSRPVLQRHVVVSLTCSHYIVIISTWLVNIFFLIVWSMLDNTHIFTTYYCNSRVTTTEHEHYVSVLTVGGGGLQSIVTKKKRTKNRQCQCYVLCYLRCETFDSRYQGGDERNPCNHGRAAQNLEVIT